MARFIHITDSKNTKSIIRSGIKAIKQLNGNKGVYCHAVLNDYMKTHQWARELTRTGSRNLTCIQFKIRDGEKVLIGRYNEMKISVTSAEAIRISGKHQGFSGLEIFISRKIEQNEIERTYPAPKITGWRYYPEAKHKIPYCSCKYCIRGQIKAKRLKKVKVLMSKFDKIFIP